MNKKIKVFSLLILFFAILLFSNISYCADGNLKASQSTSGEKITATITSTKKLGAFTLTASGLTAIDGSSDAGAYGNNTISGASASGVTTLGKFVFNVPEKDTKVTFSVSQLATDIDDNDLDISSVTITLKAKETNNNNNSGSSSSSSNSNSSNSSNSSSTTTTTKSSNAYLSTLGVTPKEYDFSGFSKTKTSYSVTVPNDVDSLKVLYKTADSNATVKVSGNSGFETGSNNTIKIVVTAEDGKTTKTYTIKVTKLTEEEEKPGNVIEDEEGLFLTSLELDGIELSPEFAKDTYSYTATLDDASVTEIKVLANANKEGANVDISGNTNLVAGENTINIVVTTEGSAEQTVYQIVLTKAEEVVLTTTEGSSEGGLINDLVGNIKKYVIIAVVVIVLMILAVIILIYLLRKENKKLSSEDNTLDEKEDNEEYNVYKNDVNEFENKTSEADNFIESLYRQRNGNLLDEEEMDVEEKQTLEEINRETDKIFSDKVEGQSVEYTQEEVEEKRPRRREKGKHSK